MKTNSRMMAGRWTHGDNRDHRDNRDNRDRKDRHQLF